MKAVKGTETIFYMLLCRWLPAQEAVESTLESVVDNAYVYGRDWISQQVIFLSLLVMYT